MCSFHLPLSSANSSLRTHCRKYKRLGMGSQGNQSTLGERSRTMQKVITRGAHAVQFPPLNFLCSRCLEGTLRQHSGLQKVSKSNFRILFFFLRGIWESVKWHAFSCRGLTKINRSVFHWFQMGDILQHNPMCTNSEVASLFAAHVYLSMGTDGLDIWLILTALPICIQPTRTWQNGRGTRLENLGHIYTVY